MINKNLIPRVGCDWPAPTRPHISWNYQERLKIVFDIKVSFFLYTQKPRLISLNGIFGINKGLITLQD